MSIRFLLVEENESENSCRIRPDPVLVDLTFHNNNSCASTTISKVPFLCVLDAAVVEFCFIHPGTELLGRESEALDALEEVGGAIYGLVIAGAGTVTG